MDVTDPNRGDEGARPDPPEQGPQQWPPPPGHQGYAPPAYSSPGPAPGGPSYPQAPPWQAPHPGAPGAYAFAGQQNAPGAVPALVLGILGLTLCMVCAPFALWQGQEARTKIDRSGGALGGRGMATAGYVMGIIGTVLLGLVVLFVVLALAVSA